MNNLDWPLAFMITLALCFGMLVTVPSCQDIQAQPEITSVNQFDLQERSDIDADGYLQIDVFKEYIPNTEKASQTVNRVIMAYVIDYNRVEFIDGDFFFIPEVASAVYYGGRNRDVLRTRIVVISGLQFIEVHLR